MHHLPLRIKRKQYIPRTSRERERGRERKGGREGGREGEGEKERESIMLLFYFRRSQSSPALLDDQSQRKTRRYKTSQIPSQPVEMPSYTVDTLKNEASTGVTCSECVSVVCALG